MEENVKNHEKLFKCDICDKDFLSIRNIRKHMANIHKMLEKLEIKMNTCDICNEKFAQTNLEVHKKMFHRVGLIECGKCGKKFLYQSELKKHVNRIHEKSYIFKCDTCDRSFHVASNLKNHIAKVHEKIKNCVCKHCGKEFNECNLKEHYMKK